MYLFWHTVTRLGEAQLLLPALLAVTAWLALRAQAPRVALVWLSTTAVAALLTTATKIAFIGYGLGYAPLDFTGISGHAMFSAAILPLLARETVGAAHPRWHAPAVLVGVALAAFDGYPKMRDGGWFPAAIPTLTYEYRRLGVNVGIIPSYKDRLYGGISVQLKLKLFQ